MRGGNAALAVACVATAACIGYVHWEQKRDIRRMQQSILHDAERETFRRRVLSERQSLACSQPDDPVGRKPSGVSSQ
jgi:hypothetical protein